MGLENWRKKGDNLYMYQKERIENAMLFFARNHHKKTKKFLSQTYLYKYLAFFEFRYLKSVGDMPLELTYKAMERGPVPMEIYDNRDNPNYFSKVIFEPFETKSGKKGYLVKPNGKFNSDYFAEAELEEMKSLIEIFAKRWISANEMSEMSHKDIKSWWKTFYRQPNTNINPIEEFDRDIMTIPEEELTTAEERFLFQHCLRAV